jgi:hypothetical protein
MCQRPLLRLHDHSLGIPLRLLHATQQSTSSKLVYEIVGRADPLQSIPIRSSHVWDESKITMSMATEYAKRKFDP